MQSLSLLQDIRYGVRRLANSPGFTCIILLTLALSVGANSAIFSVVNAALLRPLPYTDADRLFMIWESNLRRGLKTRPLSQQSFSELSEQSKSFEQLAAFVASSDVGFNVAGGGEPERVPGAIVSANFFRTLGEEAVTGRAFISPDDEPGSEPVAVISRRLWARRFGKDPRAIGTTLQLNERSYTVVGVMRDGFDFPGGAEIWVPRPLQADQVMNSATRITYGLRVVARLKSGIEPERAQADLDLIAQRLAQSYPETNRGISMRLVSLREELYGDIRPTLLVLSGAVAFVLLIACANITNLLLARAAARQHEITVRAVLGATRMRLARQLLTEYLLLAAAGGALGLLLCRWLTHLLMALWPAEVRPLGEVIIDYRVLGFTLATSLLTGLLFGLLPAIHSSHASLEESLRVSRSRAAAGLRRHGLSSVIVVSEIALALLLLVGAGLMTAIFIRLTKTELGFDPRNVLTAKVTLSGRKYPDRQQQMLLLQRVLQRAEALPGVQHVGAANFLPLSSSGFHALFTIENRATLPGHEPAADCVAVTSDYFKAMGIPLSEGRLFTEGDSQNAPRVVLIDGAMARRFWPGESPLGKRLNFQGNWREVVGVVKDVRGGKPDGSQQSTQMYVPYPQFDFPWPYFHIVVRAALDDPMILATSLRDVVREVDKDQPVDSITTAEQQISDSRSLHRFSSLLLFFFAFMALVLAAVGVYGVITYYVAQRRHDIGIRIALGAQAVDVLRPLLKRGLALTVIGISIGLAAAIALSRVVTSMLYEAAAVDFTTFLLAAALLAAVTMLAVYIPARKATKVDPLTTLRSD